MNIPFPSREQVESIRKNYPPGTRVKIGLAVYDPKQEMVQKSQSMQM